MIVTRNNIYYDHINSIITIILCTIPIMVINTIPYLGINSTVL